MSKRINIKDEYREKFYRLPKVFFTNERYMKLSNNAKMAWAILRDRVDLSQKNNWIDEHGDIYFIYTNQDLMTILNIASTSTLNKVKKELLEANLLEQEKRGLNKANRLYLINPEVSMSDIYEIKHQENNLINELEDKEFGTNTEKELDTRSALGNSGHSKIERPFSESGHSKIERQDVRKSNTNDTELSETEDIKDIKDQEDELSQIDFNHLLKEKNKENDPILIEQLIEQERLEQKYSKNLLNVVRNYSKGDLDIFKKFIQTLDYAVKSAEKETGQSIELALFENVDYSIDLKEDLTRTIYEVLLKIRTDKYQKIKDPKAYLFISIKKVIIHWLKEIY